MKKIYFFALIFSFLGLNIAAAETIPDKMLSADFEQCMDKASRNKSLSSYQITSYCACVSDEIKARFTLSEYMRLAIDIQSNNLSNIAKDKISDLAAKCAAKAFK